MQGFSPSLQQRYTKKWAIQAPIKMIGSGNLANKRHAAVAKTLKQKLKRKRKY